MMDKSDKTGCVLVIGDKQVIVNDVVGFLAVDEYRVVGVYDCHEGLLLAENIKPDLILLEAYQSGQKIGGVEVCRALKSGAKTRDIPVMFVVEALDADVKSAVFAAGGVDYLVKPLQQAELLARVRLHLNLQSMQRLLHSKVLQLRQKGEEIRKHKDRLRFQATHDILTGLPNRYLFEDRLAHAIKLAARNGKSFAVLFIDINRFKFFNDFLGYASGDLLLRHIADQLVKCFRKSDTVAHFGSDQFVVLVEQSIEDNELTTLANRVLVSLSRPTVIKGEQYSASCSIGISRYPLDGEDTETLLKRADIASCNAKGRGRNKYSIYAEGMQESLYDKPKLERLLRRAIDNEEFVLYYQPQVELKKGTLVGFEALIRWQSPEQGLISPSRFIPIAEESELIVQIGEWVVESVCAQLKRWSNNGFQLVPVAVNISSKQFFDERFSGFIKRVLAENGVDSGYLEIELTESASMGNPETAILRMEKLKEVGVSISIDDFGTGYSNLAYLRRFDVDKLKVDISFVRGITNSPEDRFIVTSLIRLSHSLGLKVVAEGVETEGQCRILMEEGCDIIQGYFFRPPLLLQQALELMKDDSRLQLPTLPEMVCRYVLLVDDETKVLSSLSRIAEEQEDLVLLTAANAEEGYTILAAREIDVVVADYHMPSQDGAEFLMRVKKLYPKAIRILMTGDVSKEALVNAINKAEAFKFIEKPYEVRGFFGALQEAFEEYDRRCYAPGESPGKNDTSVSNG